MPYVHLVLFTTAIFCWIQGEEGWYFKYIIVMYWKE